jgi:hypothetical protein
MIVNEGSHPKSGSFQVCELEDFAHNWIVPMQLIVLLGFLNRMQPTNMGPSWGLLISHYPLHLLKSHRVVKLSRDDWSWQGRRWEPG